MRTYTLVAYKPSGSSRNCGRGCCGSTDTDSDFEINRGLALEELIVKMAQYRSSHDPNLHREEYRGPPWELKWFDDTGLADWEWNEEHEDYWGPDGFPAVDKKVEEQVALQEPIVKQKAAEEAERLRVKREQEEYQRRLKADAEAKEKRDKEEFERLKKKYNA